MIEHRKFIGEVALFAVVVIVVGFVLAVVARHAHGG